MIRLLLLAGLAAGMCNAQVIVRDHATGTALSSPLVLPDVGVNDFETLAVDVVNTGSAPVTVQSAVVTGPYLTLCCQTGFVLSPGQSQPLTLRFAPTQTGFFSGALQIDSLTVFLFARSIAVPSLFLQTPSGPSQAHSGAPLILTESSPFPGQFTCLLENNSSGPVSIQSLSASGDWAVANAPSLPLILQAGQQGQFTLVGLPGASSATLTGIVHIDQENYAVLAHPPMPAIHLHLPNGPLQSGQQAALSISFDSAPNEVLAGTVSLSLQTNGAVQIVDPAILFPSAASTSASFSSVAGQLTGDFGGQTSLTFQTGTTAGTLHVSAVWGYSQDEVDVPLAPAPIVIESFSATRGSSSLTLTVTGYDNTRTAGRMSFSFFDSAGAFIGGPVTADFTELFFNYFTGPASPGGMFKMTAQFPVNGGVGTIQSVQADLMNTAGDAQTAVTPFQ